jgi:hypothetical protein
VPSFDLLVAGYYAYPDPGAEFAPEVEKAAGSNLLFDRERGRLSMCRLGHYEPSPSEDGSLKYTHLRPCH